MISIEIFLSNKKYLFLTHLNWQMGVRQIQHVFSRLGLILFKMYLFKARVM